MKTLVVAGVNSIHTYNYIDLVKDQFEHVYLITNQNNPERKDIPQLVVETSVKKPLALLTGYLKIKKHLKKIKPDVLHIHQVITLAYSSALAASSQNIPVVTTAWGSDILLLPEKGFFYHKMVESVLRKSAGLTADASFVAEKMKDFLIKGSPQPEVINFGIDFIDSDFKAKEKVVYSNRLHKKLYNIDQILKMFSEFIKEPSGEGYRLVIGGVGEETENLKKLANDLGISQRVEFTGWLDKNSNNENYRKAQIFVSIPASDGTSISLLEALSAGCIPVVSDLPANREWIDHGRNGIIHKSHQNSLKPAAELYSEKVFEHNRNLARTRASKEGNRDQFLMLYEKVTGKKFT